MLDVIEQRSNENTSRISTLEEKRISLSRQIETKCMKLGYIPFNISPTYMKSDHYQGYTDLNVLNNGLLKIHVRDIDRTFDVSWTIIFKDGNIIDHIVIGSDLYDCETYFEKNQNENGKDSLYVGIYKDEKYEDLYYTIIENKNYDDPTSIEQYVKKTELPPPPDLTPYVKKTELPPPPNLAPYVKKTELPPPPDLTPYALKIELHEPPDLTPFMLTKDFQNMLHIVFPNNLIENGEEQIFERDFDGSRYKVNPYTSEVLSVTCLGRTNILLGGCFVVPNTLYFENMFFPITSLDFLDRVYQAFTRLDLSKCEEIYEIPDFLLKDNKTITEVIFPPNLIKIGEEAFLNHQMTKIILPDSVKTIGARAFFTEYVMIGHITLPKFVEYIGLYAFVGYTNQHYIIPSVLFPVKVFNYDQPIFGAFRYNILFKYRDEDFVEIFVGMDMFPPSLEPRNLYIHNMTLNDCKPAVPVGSRVFQYLMEAVTTTNTQ